LDGGAGRVAADGIVGGMIKLERLFVWAGGALFVGSLALTAWWFAAGWARTEPFAGWSAAWLDAALFSAFALHHSLFARSGVKRALAALLPERLLRSCYVWLASALLVLVLAGWQRVGGIAYRTDSWLSWVHLAIQLCGVWLITGAVRAIDPLELAGIREESGSQDLQTGGPYHLVRHPLYLGWLLIVFGPAVMTGDRLTFAIVTSVYLFVAVPWEERSLERSFGPQYQRYKQEVRWRIVPFLY
jgi:protein-S-isoprenylcysteine O-methyltransferase Ste14